jgi:hypothetical protein
VPVREVGENAQVDLSSRDGFDLWSKSFASCVDCVGYHRVTDIIDEMNDEEATNRGVFYDADFKIARTSASGL